MRGTSTLGTSTLGTLTRRSLLEVSCITKYLPSESIRGHEKGSTRRRVARGAFPCSWCGVTVNFLRVEWDTEMVSEKCKQVDGRRDHNRVWSPMGLLNLHLPERWGVVRFER